MPKASWDRTTEDVEIALEESRADAAEIRYSLTALGEALLAERSGRRFRGFGPCGAAGNGLSA